MAKNNVVPLRQEGPRRTGAAAVRLTDSAVEAMVTAIRGLIDARNLGVGDPLPSERELCEMFSSSRNTVREAMRMLKTYGVVEVRPKIGAILIDRRMDAVFDLYSFNTLELNRTTFLDTQGFRQLVEVGSIDTLFTRATAEDIAELRAFNDLMAAAPSIERAAVEDFHLHARLVAILGNRQIDELYRIMKPVILKIMENAARQRMSDSENHVEHAAIIDALEARNRLAYQYRMAAHLEAGLTLFREGPEG